MTYKRREERNRAKIEKQVRKGVTTNDETKKRNKQ
jgi:hypothetical protein